MTAPIEQVSDINHDVVLTWKAMEDARPGYELAWNMWKGKVAEIFANSTVKKALQSTGEHYRFNVVKTVITTMHARTRITSIQTGNDASQKRLDEILEANDMEVYWSQLFKYTYAYGDAYVHAGIIDSEDVVDEDEVTPDPTLVKVGVELNVHSPLNCRMIYDKKFPKRKRVFAHRWQEPDKSWSLDLWYEDRIEQWTCAENGAKLNASAWSPRLDDKDDDESWTFTNEDGEIPFFHFRTDLPYGTPEHESGYGAQHAITKTLVTGINSTESAGYGQRYRLLDKDASLEENDGVPWDDAANATASPVGDPLDGGLRGGPGTMLDLPGTKAVGEFSVANPNQFIDPTDLYLRLLAQMTDTPMYALDPKGEQPSGTARKLANQPLVSKLRERHRLFQGTVIELVLFVLKLAKVTVQSVTVNWAPLDTADNSEDWTVVESKQNAGVPQDVTLTEAGYPADMVAQWMSTDTDAMDLRRRVALLSELGDAAQKLSSAVALGALTPDQVSAVIMQVMQESRTDG